MPDQINNKIYLISLFSPSPLHQFEHGMVLQKWQISTNNWETDVFHFTLSAKDRDLRILKYYGKVSMTEISINRAYAAI